MNFNGVVYQDANPVFSGNVVIHGNLRVDGSISVGGDVSMAGTMTASFFNAGGGLVFGDFSSQNVFATVGAFNDLIGSNIVAGPSIDSRPAISFQNDPTSGFDWNSGDFTMISQGNPALLLNATQAVWNCDTLFGTKTIFGGTYSANNMTCTTLVQTVVAELDGTQQTRQTIANNTVTAAYIDNVVTNTNWGFTPGTSSTVFTTQADGWYEVTGYVTWPAQSPAATGIRQLYVTMGGVTKTLIQELGASQIISQSFSCQAKLFATNAIIINLFQTSGGSLTLVNLGVQIRRMP